MTDEHTCRVCDRPLLWGQVIRGVGNISDGEFYYHGKCWDEWNKRKSSEGSPK